MGDKYLTDVLSAQMITEVKENKICIYSGVGSGKNWFVENELIHYGNILYITSRRAKVNEILAEKICQEKITWDKDTEDIVTTTNYGIQKLVMNEKFGVHFEGVIDHFKFVVVDEAHSIYSDATFADSSFHLYAFVDFVTKKYPNIKVILMTGTPEPMEKYIGNDYKIFDFRNECINVVPKLICMIKKEKAIQYIASLPKDQKTIYYSNSATKIVSGKKSWYRKILEEGYEDKEIAICMSDKNSKKLSKSIPDLEKKCAETKEYLVTQHKLPEGTRVLLTTSTLKEGVNIKDESVKIAFCESHVLADIQQFAGRVRQGLDVLYIIEDAKQHTVNDAELKKGRLDIVYDVFYQLEALNNCLKKHIMDDKSCLYEHFQFDPGEMKSSFLYEGDISVYTLGGEAIKCFVNMIEARNPYIKFNHLTGQFDVFECRLQEQTRINKLFKNYTWLKEIEKYVEKNGINYIPGMAQEVIDTKLITEYLGEYQNKIMVDEEKATFLNEVATALAHRTRPKISTINSELEAYRIPYSLKAGTTRRKNISKRYITVLAVDEK